MKKLVLFAFLLMMAIPSLAQIHGGKKLSTDEAAGKTPDQRYVYESERKAKKKKNKKISTKKKAKIQKKQDAKMRKKKKAKH